MTARNRNICFLIIFSILISIFSTIVTVYYIKGVADDSTAMNLSRASYMALAIQIMDEQYTKIHAKNSPDIQSLLLNQDWEGFQFPKPHFFELLQCPYEPDASIKQKILSLETSGIFSIKNAQYSRSLLIVYPWEATICGISIYKGKEILRYELGIVK